MLAIDLIGTHADDMRYQSSKISLSRGMGMYYSGYTPIKDQIWIFAIEQIENMENMGKPTRTQLLKNIA